MTIFFAVLTVVGFFLTAGGIVLAYTGARKDLAKEQVRLARAEELKRESNDPSIVRTNEEKQRLYEEAGLVMATWDNIGETPVYEAERLVRMVLDSSRSNLILAGVGLLLSTVASVWSLFI